MKNKMLSEAAKKGFKIYKRAVSGLPYFKNDVAEMERRLEAGDTEAVKICECAWRTYGRTK